MVQLNRHLGPQWSHNNPPMTSPALTLPLYIPFLYSLSTQSLNRRLAPNWSQDNPLFSLPLPDISHLLIVTPSLQFFSTSSLLPLSPHQSQDNPPND